MKRHDTVVEAVVETKLVDVRTLALCTWGAKGAVALPSPAGEPVVARPDTDRAGFAVVE